MADRVPQGRLRRIGRSLVSGTLALAAGCAAARQSQGTIALVIGHERQSAPLVRISEDEPLLRIEGLSVQEGSYLQGVVDGVVEAGSPGVGTLAASGHLQAKRSPSNRDLDFSVASGSVLWSAPVGASVFGLGPTGEVIRVSGEAFRESRGIQFNWSRAGGNGDLATAVAEWARRVHAGLFSDLDSRNLFVSLHGRRTIAAVRGLSGEAEIGLVRDRNVHGFDDLSSRTRFLRLGTSLSAAGGETSADLMWVRSRFDEGLLPTIPVRRDRTLSVSLTYDRPLAGGPHHLQIDTNWALTRSTVALFENRYRQVSVGWWRSW